MWERLRPILLRHKQAILVGGLVTTAIVVVLAAVVIYLRRPATTVTPDESELMTGRDGDKLLRPPPIPQPIITWLNREQLEPDPEGGRDRGRGFPLQIRQISGEPRWKMRLHGNGHLPEDFTPDSASGDDKDLPKGIKSNKTQSLFIRIEGGQFRMGEFDGLRLHQDPIAFDDDEKNGPMVTLSTYYMQKTEVSIGEFDRFCGDVRLGEGDREFRGFSRAWDGLAGTKGTKDRGTLRGYPATGVTHGLATRYGRWVGGELPTEAQWEFAARSRGKSQPYVWRDEVQGDKTVTDMANVGNFAEKDPCEVEFEEGYSDKTGQGIYHMAGNVREWCRNPWKKYTTTPLVDPGEGPADGEESCAATVPRADRHGHQRHGSATQPAGAPAAAAFRTRGTEEREDHRRPGDRSRRGPGAPASPCALPVRRSAGSR